MVWCAWTSYLGDGDGDGDGDGVAGDVSESEVSECVSDSFECVGFYRRRRSSGQEKEGPTEGTYVRGDTDPRYGSFPKHYFHPSQYTPSSPHPLTYTAA